MGCLFVVFYFRNSVNMEAAYGLTITIAMLSLTVLLGFFLRHKLRWSKIAVAASIIVFGGIELMFFVANIVKFHDGGYITVLLGGAFFTVMYVCYYARKIHNKYLRFVNLTNYAEQIAALSVDTTIPKLATHLVYLTKANKSEQVEWRIMESILSTHPKRADVYWLFHVNRVATPYTLNYEVADIMPGKILKIQLNIGFRVRCLTELYFNRILRDLSSDPARDLPVASSRIDNTASTGDYSFVLLHRELSIENEFHLGEGLLLKTYFLLHRISQSDTQAFGLNRTNVRIEHVPLVYQPPRNIALSRKT
jgi:KUP system potassium uptake protein